MNYKDDILIIENVDGRPLLSIRLDNIGGSTFIIDTRDVARIYIYHRYSDKCWTFHGTLKFKIEGGYVSCKSSKSDRYNYISNILSGALQYSEAQFMLKKAEKDHE